MATHAVQMKFGVHKMPFMMIFPMKMKTIGVI